MQPISAQHVAVGQAIRQRRKALGWTQDTLAEASGVTRNWIGSVELGKGNISLTDLLGIAAALDVAAAEIVAAADGSGSETV